MSFCFAARSITCDGLRKGIGDIARRLRSLGKPTSEFAKRFSQMRMI